MIMSARTRPAGGGVEPGHSADPAIHLADLSKVFDSGFHALADIELDVVAGEFVSIVGPSGCGKSTLLRVMAGLTAARGTIEVEGVPITGPRPDIGMMFQKPALLEWKTALENVLVPVAVARRITSGDIREGLRLLQLFGLDGFAYRFPSQLSGGMQQRVALARLMMTGASVRLLDEPFGAVDELTRERLNLELLNVHDMGTSTTVLVTHSISEAVLLSDRIIVMAAEPGRIVADLAVPLPRPRTSRLLQTPEFQAIAFAARTSLFGHLEEAANPHA